MSYQEKKALSGIVVMLLMVAGYCAYAFGKISTGAAASNDLKFWAGTMLLFIGIGIAAMIVVQIVFAICISILTAIKEKDACSTKDVSDEKIKRSVEAITTEDEMDRLIALKTAKISYSFLGIGIIASLVLLLIGFSVPVMLNVLFFASCIGGLCEGIVTIYYYKAGVHNAR